MSPTSIHYHPTPVTAPYIHHWDNSLWTVIARSNSVRFWVFPNTHYIGSSWSHHDTPNSSGSYHNGKCRVKQLGHECSGTRTLSTTWREECKNTCRGWSTQHWAQEIDQIRLAPLIYRPHPDSSDYTWCESFYLVLPPTTWRPVEYRLVLGNICSLWPHTNLGDGLVGHSPKTA